MPYEISAFSINPTNTQVLTGCASDTWVRLHDYKTGELLGRFTVHTHQFQVSNYSTLDTYKGHHGPVHSIAYSPDGCIGATGSEDGTIRLWKMTPEPYGLWA